MCSRRQAGGLGINPKVFFAGILGRILRKLALWIKQSMDLIFKFNLDKGLLTNLFLRWTVEKWGIKIWITHRNIDYWQKNFKLKQIQVFLKVMCWSTRKVDDNFFSKYINWWKTFESFSKMIFWKMFKNCILKMQ